MNYTILLKIVVNNILTKTSINIFRLKRHLEHHADRDERLFLHSLIRFQQPLPLLGCAFDSNLLKQDSLQSVIF